MRRREYRSKQAEIKDSDDADHIYYNLNLTNPNVPNNNLVLANFDETRSTAILKTPSEYTMSVIRFSLSKVNIPIFFMNIFPQYDNIPLFEWNATNVYILNQGTLFDGKVYKSLLPINIGNNPVTMPAAWTYVPTTASPWSATSLYSFQTGVTYNNVVYISNIDGNVGNQPNISPVQWTVSQLPPVLDNICYNLSKYAVSMVYGLQMVTEYLIYEPVDQEVIPPNDWTIVDSSNANYYGVNIFSQFIEMINKALKSCYNHMDPMSPPKVAGAQAPYLLLDPATLLISLVAHRSFDQNPVQANTISIYFNTALMTFFRDALQYDQYHSDSFETPFDFKLTVQSRGDNFETLLYPDVNYPNWQDNLNYTIGHGTFFSGTNLNYVAIANSFNKQPDVNPGFWTVQAQPSIPTTYSATATYATSQVVLYQGLYYTNISGNNTVVPSNDPAAPNVDWMINLTFDMLVMKQDYACLYNWVDIQTILFVCQLIPIVDEFVPAGVNNPNSTLGTAGLSNPTLQIISDFVPDVQTGTDINSNIVYFTQGEYRLANLVSDTPLRSIKIQIYYTDRYNQLFPLYLEPYGVASCKILFRKKHIKSGLSLD